MPRFPYPWQDYCVSVQRETDSIEALRLLELAICAIEKRSAEWQMSPGTAEEVAAIPGNLVLRCAAVQVVPRETREPSVRTMTQFAAERQLVRSKTRAGAQLLTCIWK